jgi:hypothetical protein
MQRPGVFTRAGDDGGVFLGQVGSEDDAAHVMEQTGGEGVAGEPAIARLPEGDFLGEFRHEQTVLPKHFQGKAGFARHVAVAEYLQTEHERFDRFKSQYRHGVHGIGHLLRQGKGGGIGHLEQPGGDHRVAGDDGGNGLRGDAGRLDFLEQIEIGGRQAGQAAQLWRQLAEVIGGQPGIEGQAAFEARDEVRGLKWAPHEAVRAANGVDDLFLILDLADDESQRVGTRIAHLAQQLRPVPAGHGHVGHQNVKRLLGEGRERGRCIRNETTLPDGVAGSEGLAQRRKFDISESGKAKVFFHGGTAGIKNNQPNMASAFWGEGLREIRGFNLARPSRRIGDPHDLGGRARVGRRHPVRSSRLSRARTFRCRCAGNGAGGRR